MSRAIPTLPARFRLGRRLGEGGMGTVYEALDGEHDERVAIKVLKQGTHGGLARFKREFRSLQDIHHPNLVTLGELFSEGDEWFFTMELVKGDDFVSWVTRSSFSQDGIGDGDAAERDTGRPPPLLAFDEKRLRTSLVQLAQGLGALHEAQKVHRDVKPSNVLVDGEGRVVVLDFGLVHDLAADLGPTMTDLDVVGTPAYMAPEQAASRAVGPAADWYAVGVLLYETLTGQLPFEGAPLEVLLAKQRSEPKPPSSIAQGIPADLDDLCTRLLHFDPTQRPTGRQILRALDAAPSMADRPSMSLSSMSLGVPFVGREPELAELRRAFEDSRMNAVTLLVYGESGIGKSCMLRHFTDAVTSQDREVLLLQGRCYERESVPYKAFDGVVDAIARFLGRLQTSAVERFLPTRPARLLQLFPTLRRVEAIAQAPGVDDAVLDPHETRARAFSAMRELLARIADAHRLIILIDDLQWADADSFALLHEILRPPEEASFLLLGTVREGASEASIAAKPDEDPATLLAGDVRRIDLARLPREDARVLVSKLVQRIAPELPISADTLAEEADGHPLFIDEIVRHLFLVGASQGPLRLEDVLWSRVSVLEDLPRRIIGVLSVATSPLSQTVVAKAIEATPSDLARTLSFLRVAHLVRTTGARGSDLIEVFHGRVRDAVLANTSDEACRRLHLRIAIALESTGSTDADLLGTHWLGAGDKDKAAKHILAAADRAAGALAFDRAASLYAWTLELREGGTRKIVLAEMRQLQTKLGNALVSAGRGARAAQAYRAAAIGANEAEAIDLRSRAADQLLRSGHFDEGLSAIQEVLASIGMTLPEAPWRALVALVLWRIVLTLRGLRYQLRDASHLAARDLTRIDACYAVASSLALVDPVCGQLFQTRNILWSLRSGEPHRVSRALSLEVAYRAFRGWPQWDRTNALDLEARELARQIGEPHTIAWSLATSGTAKFLGGFFEDALATCDEAEKMFVTQCAGASWETAATRLFALQSLSYMGQMKELTARQAIALRAATERGDLYATVNLRIGHANLVWLAADDPARARQEATEAMHEWSKRGFHLEHYFELLALANADLYEGNAHAAFERVSAQWAPLQRSLIPRIQAIRMAALHLRGRAALAVAACDPKNKDAMLAIAERDARAIAREKTPWAVAWGTTIDAGIALARGERERGVLLLKRTATEADRAKLALVAGAARFTLGKCIGGDEGARLVAEAKAPLTAQDVKAPERMLALVGPQVRS
jgi:tRNA A-37 threonylcarbamoyl transferase component Bud32